MKKTGKLLLLLLILSLTAVPVAMSQSPQPKPESSSEPIMVGRISFVEGQLLRYVPSEKDWVATVKDAPFGLDDALYSVQDGKAEFIIPNGTWIRIGSDTQIQLIALREDVSEIDVASGVSRFYNKGGNTLIKVTTPFGYVMASPGTAFDLYVGDVSVEVIAITGTVDFVLNEDTAKYEVSAGSGSLLSDGKAVEQGAGTVDAAWDDWNAAREEAWTKRVSVKGDSTRYLPPNLGDDAYDLDQNGRWETVDYEGQQRTLWRPTSVDNDWAPFTRGRWTEWNEDNTWVPEESFGYVTHHYGNWVRVDSCGCWYWAPPAPRVEVAVGVPVYDNCACWYPGRVAWIHSSVDIGWIPLAPAEPYYSHHYWGPRAVVMAGGGFAAVNINIGGYRWFGNAVIVNQRNFYGVNNYSRVRITNINNTTIINNYRGAPVVNNTVISNYNTNRQRYNFNNDIRVANKPHADVVRRIDDNRRIAGQIGNVNARGMEQRVSAIQQGKPAGGERIQQPWVSNKIVPADQVNKPRSEIPARQKGLKGNQRPPRETATGVRPGAGTPGRSNQGQPGEQGKQGIISPRGAQGQPGQAGRTGIKPPRGQQLQPGETGKSGITSPRTTGRERGQQQLERQPQGQRQGQQQLQQQQQDRKQQQLERRQQQSQPQGQRQGQQQLQQQQQDRKQQQLERRQQQSQPQGQRQGQQQLQQQQQDRKQQQLERRQQQSQPQGQRQGQQQLQQQQQDRKQQQLERRQQQSQPQGQRQGQQQLQQQQDRKQQQLERRQQQSQPQGQRQGQQQLQQQQQDRKQQQLERRQQQSQPQGQRQGQQQLQQQQKQQRQQPSQQEQKKKSSAQPGLQ